MYGKKTNQNCQNARRFLRTNEVKVNFKDITKKANKEELINETEVLEKTGNYKFKSLTKNDQPIVVSPKTREVLVGYEPGTKLYNNILKTAEKEKLEYFLEKYPELSNKNLTL